MKRLFIFSITLLFLVSAPVADAQDTLVTFDQPGYSTAAFVIPRNSLQFEFGTGYNPTTGLNETIFPALVVRVPVFKKTEFRLSVNYEPQSNIFILDNVDNNHDPTAVGLKYKLFAQQKARPNLVLMGNVFYPTQRFNKTFLPGELCADLWLIAHNYIGEKHELFYTAGYIRGNERLRDILSWTFCYNYMLTSNVGIFGEYYGFQYFYTGQHEFGFDAGATYEFGNRFQLDVCYYYNIDPVHRMGYITGGISYNLMRGKKG